MTRAEIETRLRQKPTLWEVFAIGFGILLSIGFVYLRKSQGFDTIQGIDFGIFINSVDGDTTGFYYPNWIIPLFALIRLLHFPALMYVIWNSLNIMGIFFAGRVFGGKIAIALLSYQMLFSLYFGQIVGVIVVGLAFYWWMLHRKQPLIAGLGAVFALVKPQMSIPVLLVMAFMSTASWRERIISSLASFAALGLSMLIWQGWIPDFIQRMQSEPPMTAGSIALWEYVGAWCLLLWLPVLFVPMPPLRRLILVTATTSIATPYYIHNGLLSLFVMPIGYLGLLGNLGYAMAFIGWWGVKLTALAPLAVYVWLLGQSFREWRNAKSHITT